MKYENEDKFFELANTLENNAFRENFQIIIRRCRDGSYHDFKSELATPKMQMVQDLRDAGLEHDAQRVIDGEYDQ